MGTLAEVQGDLNSSLYFFGGMKQFPIHLSRHSDQNQVCTLASSGSVLYFSLTLFGESAARCHDSVLNIFSAIPQIRTISPCNFAVPRPDLLYADWVGLGVFGFSKLLVLLQQPEFDSPDYQPS